MKSFYWYVTCTVIAPQSMARLILSCCNRGLEINCAHFVLEVVVCVCVHVSICFCWFSSPPPPPIRTSTVILVDRQGEVLFTERTMVEPIDPHSPRWTTNAFSFKITTT